MCSAIRGAIDSLRAKIAVRERPMRSRTNPTRNWLCLPIVGRKGLPDAACQTSCSDESMCLRYGSARGRMGTIGWAGWQGEVRGRSKLCLARELKGSGDRRRKVSRVGLYIESTIVRKRLSSVREGAIQLAKPKPCSKLKMA